MIDELSKEFLNNPIEKNAIKLIEYTTTSKMFNTSILLCKYFRSVYDKSIDIKKLLAHNNECLNDYNSAFDIYDNILEESLLLKESTDVSDQRLKIIDKIKNRYVDYNKTKIDDITKKIKEKKDKIHIITFTITTCKRYTLFEQTINSFINTCIDIDKIDRWICIDDNSSEDDRLKMKTNYPFFEFYNKTSYEKGHARSLNILLSMIKTPYIFHIEDDWLFFSKQNYIEKCLKVLSVDDRIGQCLINKNYMEIPMREVLGGTYKTIGNLRYYEHEHCKTPEDYEIFYTKNGVGANSAYWPHYSLRPSMIRREVFNTIGQFNESKNCFFEREYADRFISKGFISAFLETIYCIHTGRLTSEKDDITKENAYSLNNEGQFGQTPKEVIKQDTKEPIKEVIKQDTKENIKEIYTLTEYNDFIDSLNKNLNTYIVNKKVDTIDDLLVHLVDNILSTLNVKLDDHELSLLNKLSMYFISKQIVTKNNLFKQNHTNMEYTDINLCLVINYRDFEILTKSNKFNKNFLESKEIIKIFEDGLVNNTPSKLPSNIKYHVINLDRRPDRYMNFCKESSKLPVLIHRYSAIDGKKLKSCEQLEQLFEGNDYNMQASMIGCAMSHIDLYIQLINSSYDSFMIFEDDITFNDDFVYKFNAIYSTIKTVDWDILFIGYHTYDESRKNKHNPISLEHHLNFIKFSNISIGGAFGYLISKKGAQKMLDYINENSMIQCVDTMHQRACEKINIYLSNPMIIYSNFVDPKNSHVDSDIWGTTSFLTTPFSERLIRELNYYKQIEVIKDLNEIDESNTNTVYFYFEPSNDFKKTGNSRVALDITKKYRYSYNIENLVIVVVNPSEKILQDKFFNRLKKNNKFNIDDILKNYD